MRVAKVLGKVTLSRCLPCFEGASFRLAVPLSLTDLRGETEPEEDSLVVIDELGAGEGCHIAVSDGAEAAQPFRPAMKPVDAYNSAILDHVDVGEKQ